MGDIISSYGKVESLSISHAKPKGRGDNYLCGEAGSSSILLFSIVGKHPSAVRIQQEHPLRSDLARLD